MYIYLFINLTELIKIISHHAAAEENIYGNKKSKAIALQVLSYCNQLVIGLRRMAKNS